MYSNIDSESVSTAKPEEKLLNEGLSYKVLQTQETAVRVNLRNCQFAEYNFFVRQYNADTNRIGRIYLGKIPSCRFLDIRNPWKLALSMILCFVPFVCFLILFLSALRFISLCLIILRVKMNRWSVKNPFANMVHFESVYHLVLYTKFNTIHEVRNLVGQFIEPDEESNLVERFSRSPATLEVMLYKTEFYNFEKKVLDSMHKRIITSLIMIGCSTFMSYTTIYVILL